MNNGKVRIYELSRELNLDNRDILAVCDQLNISVKSHSSTISDAEAARIRSAAEKYIASHPSPSKSAVSTHSAGSKSSQSSTSPPVKKQQILEIRRHRPTIEPPKRPEVEPPTPSQAPVPPSAASSPSRPVARLNSPNRPALSEFDTALDTEATLEHGLEEELTAELPVASSEEVPAVEEPSVEPDSVSEQVEQPYIEEIRVEAAKPQPLVKELVVPPSRPSANRPALENTPRPNLTNRPILKRAKAEAGESSKESRSPVEGTRLEAGVGSPSRVIQPKRVVPSAGGDEAPVLKAKPTIELRRKPVRPGTSSEAGTQDDGEATANKVPGVIEPLELELRRPTLPKTVKRGKAWEEEEEDPEIPQKAAKVGAKSKRRAQPLLDDEDEDIIDLDDASAAGDDLAPAQVSLSLMRPPKPKGRTGQVKPMTPATPVQRKKGAGGESSRTVRRDRREQEVKERPTVITLSNSLSVHDLADELVVPETEIIKALFFKGIAANINQILDIPTAAMVAQEFGIEVETVEAEAEAKKVTEMLDEGDLENLHRRPPVVTIMGHVDHGKTTLLDSIRKTKVAQGEAGGITQHIGAYHVDVEHAGQMQQVVFLDTPGHEAFTAMRARGTRVTDIAVLVVAADDGVRPQTVEAVSHAKAAGVPIVVAINKVDKEEAQPDRVKQELTEYGLLPEEWGGDTIMVPVSALTGDNLDTLLEMLLLVAEVEDLYANPDRPAKGTIIEANLDKARGPVATLLVQNGTLHVGDVIVAGSAFGKVRAMVDDRGKRVEVAEPSFAVQVLGFNDVPAAGDEFEVFRDEKEARSTASSRGDQQRLSRLQQAMASRRVSLNTLSAKAQEGELKELNLILKADVQGSVEAILNALQQLPQKEVQLRVLLAAPGEITETDVDLASASDAVILGFNTTLASGSRQAADDAGVDIRDYNIIYKLLEDVQGAMEGLLEPEMVEEPLGRVEVRAVFPVGRGAVAGCYVQSGKAVRNCKIRVLRGSSIVFEGNLDSLKRMKDDVKEVNAGYECGIGLDSFKDWEMGDIIETYRLVTKRRTLSA